MLIMVLNGCLFLAFPTPGHRIDMGEVKISKADIRDFEVGKTTREEVLLQFGEPSAQFSNGKTIVYHWRVVKGYWIFEVGTGADPAGGSGAFRNYYQVVFEFDEQGLLERCERTAPGRSEARGKAFSSDLLQIPKGKAALFVYRPDADLLASVTIPVSVDAQHLAAIQNKGFAIAIVEPGTHTVSRPSTAYRETLSTSSQLESLSFEMQADERVFLKVCMDYETREGTSVPVVLSVVPEAQAITEIERTRRSAVIRPLTWGKNR
jgi:hypothetical protein